MGDARREVDERVRRGRMLDRHVGDTVALTLESKSDASDVPELVDLLLGRGDTRRWIDQRVLDAHQHEREAGRRAPARGPRQNHLASLRPIEAHDELPDVTGVGHITARPDEDERLIGAANDLARDAAQDRASERPAGPGRQAQQRLWMLPIEAGER